MLTTLNFYTIGQWLGIFTIILGILTVFGFIFQWGFRFRLVGVTGFLCVLTGGLFSLYLGLYDRPEIQGSIHYSRTYDNGGNQVVIAVTPQITPSELEATLRQASSDLFSYGRGGQSDNQMFVRVRTIIHPEPGVSQPLFLGEVKRSLSVRDDGQIEIQIFPDNVAQLPNFTPSKNQPG